MAQTNSKIALSQSHPELAAQWYPIKNGSLTPDQVVAGSNKKAWWICPKGPDHEWQASIGHRTAGKGCPCCAGQKISVTNSLAALYPEIAAQWHPTKNGSLTPEQVATGTAKKAWWICTEGPDNEWEALISNRTSLGHGCSYCTGRSVSVTVGNQQKWDTFVKERSGGCGSVVGLPALPVVAFAPS